MFDRAAETYDTNFTHSNIGRLQRGLVMHYMNKLLTQVPNLRILELNAGTGEDAITMAKMGHSVLALDISAKMVNVAQQKIQKTNVSGQIEFMCGDIRHIDNLGLNMEFDIVFSDFGGLNCLQPAELKKLSQDLLAVLKPGGRFIAVLMSQCCLWESFYFLIKLQLDKVFRRATNDKLSVLVNGMAVDTWYYSPRRYHDLMREQFRKIALRPIGFFIPPSYMEPAFISRAKLLNLFGKADRNLFKIPWLANASDHYIMDLERIN
ncbi:MAG: class I SAM-dependent methyltransferase [Bacteroidetes bacterium]|nr:class I SAM-dependent methyltransferase [Bacteroidota bacterium]